jgi:hypothetical protein
VSLSHQTVSRFIEMGDVSNTMRYDMNDCEYCSLGSDESTDITDVCQIIFVRTIYKYFQIKEFLKLQSLTADTMD